MEDIALINLEHKYFFELLIKYKKTHTSKKILLTDLSRAGLVAKVKDSKKGGCQFDSHRNGKVGQTFLLRVYLINWVPDK